MWVYAASLPIPTNDDLYELLPRRYASLGKVAARIEVVAR
jgi:hypothetical protein